MKNSEWFGNTNTSLNRRQGKLMIEQETGSALPTTHVRAQERC